MGRLVRGRRRTAERVGVDRIVALGAEEAEAAHCGGAVRLVAGGGFTRRRQRGGSRVFSSAAEVRRESRVAVGSRGRATSPKCI